MRYEKIKIYKESGLLEDWSGAGRYDIVPDVALAEILLVSSSKNVIDGKINIVLGGEPSESYIDAPENITDNELNHLLSIISITYYTSPRIKKIEILNEQNELLSEANKGLVDLYNLIDNKNKQIEYLKNKLEKIINSAASGILEVNAERKIVFANRMFFYLTGYEPEEVTDIDFLKLLVSGQRDDFILSMTKASEEGVTAFASKMIRKDGIEIDIDGHITILEDEGGSLEIIFDDISEKLKIDAKVKKLEEKAIVAGFSRHLSHNILNALTVSSGFIKKIKGRCENTKIDPMWKIVDDKCMVIEEIVTGYNDYTNAISMKVKDRVDLKSFYESLIKDLALKEFEKTFSAFLYNFTDSYSISYNFSYKNIFEIDCNIHFLKLALCYIIKDTIRFFSDSLPLSFHVKTIDHYGRFALKVEVHNVEVNQDILDTMFQPWNHQMLSQSFDYWGIVIANVIAEKHGGLVHLKREDYGVSFIIGF